MKPKERCIHVIATPKGNVIWFTASSTERGATYALTRDVDLWPSLRAAGWRVIRLRHAIFR